MSLIITTRKITYHAEATFDNRVNPLCVTSISRILTLQLIFSDDLFDTAGCSFPLKSIRWPMANVKFADGNGFSHHHLFLSLTICFLDCYRASNLR